MVSPAAGKVVLVPFPFSDLSQSKLRPAVVVVGAGRGDWALCQITSNPYAGPHAVSLTNASFAKGSLRAANFARPGKLFTAGSILMFRKAGLLTEPATRKVIDAIIEIPRPNSSR